MMTEVLQHAAEIMGPIALVAMLASAYGTLRNSLRSEAATQYLLGGLFGLGSVVMMHAPIAPFEGLIIDLRNVPIALAGAFLGIRGLAICLVIAALARAGIGGVGTMSGLAAMTIAGFAGFLWAERRRMRRDMAWRDYAVLCAMVNCHLLAVLLLPTEMALWFLTHAAGPIVALNCICLPLVARLLDREALRLETRLVSTAAQSSDLKGLFRTEADLSRDLGHRQASDGRDSVAGLIAIRLNYAPWIARVWGTGALGTILGAMRCRLPAALRQADLAGLSDDGFLLVPLTREEIELGERIETRLQRALTAQPIDLGPDEWTRISVSTRVTSFGPDQAGAHFSFRRPEPRPLFTAQPATAGPSSPPTRAEAAVTGQLQSALFSKADQMMRSAR